MPGPETKLKQYYISFFIWFCFNQLNGQPKMWKLYDLEGQPQFSVFADTVYAIDQQLFVINFGPETILFRNDPFHPVFRSATTNWFPGLPGTVLQKRQNLYFPTNSLTLKSDPSQVYDSVLIWNKTLLGRKPKDKSWVWNPGHENELVADSFELQDGKLLLFQFRGIVLIDSNQTTQFVSNSGVSRKLNSGFKYTLSDSTWLPLQPSLNTIKQINNANWWNDTTLIDFENNTVFLQSARIVRKQIADSGSIINPNFLLLKSKAGFSIMIANGIKVKIDKPLKYKILDDTILGIKTSLSWLIITKTGLKSKVNKSVSELKAFSEGLVLAKSGKRFGFVDVNGFIRIAFRYDSLLPFDKNGLVAAKLGSQWGYLNKSEKIIVQPHFSIMNPFKGGLSAVCQNEKWGLINPKGEFVMGLVNDTVYAGMYSGWNLRRNRWYGWANENGEIILQAKYFHTIEASKGRIKVIRDGKSGLFDNSGQALIPLENQIIIVDLTNRHILTR